MTLKQILDSMHEWSMEHKKRKLKNTRN
ncbi:hypothetical protein [Oceanobacillus sp. CF4.6]